MKLRRIFHPTDLSPNAAVALRFSLEIAHRFDAELHVGHVVANGREYWDAEDLDRLDDADLKRRLREYVYAEMVRMNWPRDRDVRTRFPVIRHETPHAGIVRFARQWDVDLIIVGTHGRRGVRRFLLGSVASRVLHDAHTDLVVVPFGYRERSGGRVLVPVDLCDRSAPLLRNATEVAAKEEARLHLLHVLELPPAAQLLGEETAGAEVRTLPEVAAERLEALASSIDAAVKPLVHVKIGSPAAAILQYVEERDVRLIMMASSGMSPDERLRRYPREKGTYEELRWAIGPVTERVATHSEAPVWVVKKFAEPSWRGNEGVEKAQYTMAEIAREV